MDIAIIGTGNVGRALATSLTRAGHRVTLAARDEAKTRSVAAELGTASASSPRDAVQASEVAIIAVPFHAAEQVAREIAPVASGKVVIDSTNPLKADLSGLATEGGPSIAEQLAAKLPGATVAKAFNTLFASVQADPTGQGVTVDGFYATDDEHAAATVASVLSSIGLRPVNAGKLSNARSLEALAFLNIKLQVEHRGKWNSAFVMTAAPEAAVGMPIAA